MYLLNQHTEDALDRVFEGFFSSANNGLTRNYKTETNDDNYIVEMALPGYDKKDIKLSTKDNSLTIESSEHDEWKGVPCLELNSTARDVAALFEEIEHWLRDGFKPEGPEEEIDWVSVLHG